MKNYITTQEIIDIYKDEFLEEIVSNTKSKLIDVRGNVAVLYKRK